jgi:tRNA G18 (ribose-2'-O)-methylase SpoU
MTVTNQEIHHEQGVFTSTSHRMYLVIYNIQSKSNVRDLMNTAFAFGCAEVWLVGQTKNDQKSKLLSRQFQEALHEQQIKLVVFSGWKDVLEHLTKFPQIALVGVEIDAQSEIMNDRDVLPRFTSDYEDIAILMGNEGQGIHPKHLEACQGRLIRIPQYGTGTASLNVNVACSIVLYHFHQWKYRTMAADGYNGFASGI